jgi:hypothetical protein
VSSDAVVPGPSVRRGRSANAQRAVDLYNALHSQFHWTEVTAWHGIAILLLTCQIQRGNKWRPFHDVVVYRERNDFKIGVKGPNKILRRAEDLTNFIAQRLSVSRADVCSTIGQYWRDPSIKNLQQHNLVGNAFRSLVVNALEVFGDPGISYEEEVDIRNEFRGHIFQTRSKASKIDIIAKRGGVPVALLSTRWRYRHDRVDVLDEAYACGPPARRTNPHAVFYAVFGEFAPNRLEKVLSNCPPAMPTSEIAATVHFAPELITNGLGENGRMAQLKSIEWLIQQTHSWH